MLVPSDPESANSSPNIGVPKETLSDNAAPRIKYTIPDISRKTDTLVKLQPKQDARPKELELANKSKSLVEDIEIFFQKEDDEIKACATNILRWKQKIAELQSKVKKAEDKHFELQRING
ncbi:unnamed protein product [Vicia faba]|uniref:Uncharacterized protein n=1 Tax=Vicia faba TaxID=3906 RepID=A0AAV1B9E9_VICFA|nr:unnamed protein product [Vicia faba]